MLYSNKVVRINGRFDVRIILINDGIERQPQDLYLNSKKIKAPNLLR
ncbi:hypothetical protein [Peribacillus deserti]|nr:hypothetical protein [Peribacillus deserti]